MTGPERSDADEVEVHLTFDDSWVPGYEVCGLSDTDDEGEQTFRLRRQSDGVELPVTLASGRVRRVETVESAGSDDHDRGDRRDGPGESIRVAHDGWPFQAGGGGGRAETGRLTSSGWRIGVWLTTEAAPGRSAAVFDVDRAALEGFEVTEAGSEHRSFVVPGPVADRLGVAGTGRAPGRPPEAGPC